MLTINLSDGRKLRCPRYISGRDLLTLLKDWSTITLGSVTPLKNGDALRAFRFIDANVESIDMNGYADLFQADRQFIGRIINA